MPICSSDWRSSTRFNLDCSRSMLIARCNGWSVTSRVMFWSRALRIRSAVLGGLFLLVGATGAAVAVENRPASTATASGYVRKRVRMGTLLQRRKSLSLLSDHESGEKATPEPTFPPGGVEERGLLRRQKPD